MDRLYLVPVGEDWKADFERTVETPFDLTGDTTIDELDGFEEARIWGTTWGRQKETFFDDMESGDPILFYHGGEYFATGRVGQTFKSQETGKWLWDSPESEYIYTVENFEEISLPREELNDKIGYSENHVPQRFLKVSESAVNSLLQEYTSIEAAFQDFKGDQEPDPPETTTGDDEDVREHTKIQWYLIQLGLKHNYDVYVAKNDRHREYNGQRLGDECIENLNLTGFSEAAMGIIEYVDVIWLDGDYIVKMFEVESTTSIFSGILRMTDFVVKVRNLAVNMYIAAPSDDEDKVRREMERPTFQRVLEPAEYCSLQYISFEDVRETHETVEQAGPLQTVF